MDVIKFHKDVESYVNSKLAVFKLCGESHIEAVANVCKDYLGVVLDDEGHLQEYKDISDDDRVHIIGDCILLTAISDTIIKASCGKLNEE